jgi:Cellulase (glycosyl hydrolase family 5)
VDPNHILFLDGNTYSMDFSHFTEIFPNTVYAIHDYSLMGFPIGEPYVGSEEQKSQLRKQYARKTEFHTTNNTAVWNGEFGPLYAYPKYEPDHEAINAQRYALLGEQMKIYNDEAKVSWTIWLYKDIGLQGMVYADPESPWMKLIGPFLEKKKELQLDMWGKYPSEEADAVMKPLTAWIEKACPSMKTKYPSYWGTLRHLDRAVLHCLLADQLQMEFAELFRDKSMEELEVLVKSFHFDQCVQRETLNKMMSDKARM